MTWRETLIAERDQYAASLTDQRIIPGQNWPQSQEHYLNRIEQINRILATNSGSEIEDVIPRGRITRAVV